MIERISIAHVIIIIKSEVSTFPIVIIFCPWLRAWDACYFIFCYLLDIRSGKTGNLFSLLLCSLWWVQIVGYVLACRSYSFVCTVHHLIMHYHCANLSEDIELKMPVRYILSSLWVRLSICSQLSIRQYVGLCVFSLPISFVMIEMIYMLCLIIIIKSEVWTITHCLGLGHETMVCVVGLSIFFWKCRLQNASHFLSALLYYFSEPIQIAAYINLSRRLLSLGLKQT